MPEIEPEADVSLHDALARLAPDLDARSRVPHVNMTHTHVDLDGYTWRGVLIAHKRTVYEVVPIEREGGGGGLVYYAEHANGAELDNDDERLPRAYLARLALTFLASGLGSENYVPAATFRPESRRPNDATLLRIVRNAIADNASARSELARVFDVSKRTADDWIAYARRLPEAADLPPARRGRPRKTTDHTRESNR